MSNASSSPEEALTTLPVRVTVPWRPLIALLFVVGLYYASQLVGGLTLTLYAGLRHWSNARATDWLSSSVVAQFFYILIAEATVLLVIRWFLKHYKTAWSAIGLEKPRWRDVGYGVLAAPLYYVIYLVAVSAVSHLVPALNVTQQQEIGFNDVHGAVALSLTFISLVILPPLTEEIMIRGFLYTSLKKAMPLMSAALVASAIFAAAHLPEGGTSGPLYIAALDTFILSLVLIYVREKSGSLWGSITLHAIKNGIAFLALFVFHLA